MSGRTLRVLTVLLILLAVCIVGIAVLKGVENSVNKPPEETVSRESTSISQSNPSTDSADNTDSSQSHVTAVNTDNMSPPDTSADNEAEILGSAQVFVYDITDGIMKYRYGTDNKIVPASITKLLTALTALDMMPEDTVINPGDELELVSSGSSLAYIKTYHSLTLSMLIEGMLLPSGNDAAYATAAGAARYATGNPDMSGQEAVDYFMKKVNEYAVKLGCTDTHFTVPDGLAYKEHYTTADDLAIIAQKALDNPVISHYASLSSDKVMYASGHMNEWHNTNLLIDSSSKYYRESVTGLKTGSLTDSYSVLISADINGKTYVIGVFNAPSSTERYVIADLIIDGLG